MAHARLAALALTTLAAALAFACGGGDAEPLPAVSFLDALDEAGVDYSPTGEAVVCARLPRTAGVVYSIEGREFVLFEFPSAEERGYDPSARGDALPLDEAEGEVPQGTAFHGCRWTIEHVFWNNNLVLTTESPGDSTDVFEASSDAAVAAVVNAFFETGD